MSDSETEFSSDHEEGEYDDDEMSDVNADEAKELREQLQDVPLGEIKKLKDQVGLKPVSYTHLTLPTIYSV